jgi:hypothetical protein
MTDRQTSQSNRDLSFRHQLHEDLEDVCAHVILMTSEEL